MNKRYNVLDLFSGAGGFSYGFKNAGFNIVAAIEKDMDAIKTHELNFPDSKIFNRDITTFTDNEINSLFSNVDIIIGGPPCQGFSIANLKRDILDPRNKLFLEYVKFVRLIKPKIFILENVKGLLSLNKGQTKDAILFLFSELGYNIEYQVLNSADYGIPQKRQRVFFVGVRSDLNKRFTFNLEKENLVTIEEAIKDLYHNNGSKDGNIEQQLEPITSYQKKIWDSPIIKNHYSSALKEVTLNKIKYVSEGQNWRSIPKELLGNKERFSTAYYRLDSQDISPTVDTFHRNIFHPKVDRFPTVRENARLQSFPDSFVFIGSKTSQYKQVGNAVPPILAEKLGNAIKDLLEN